jgi:Uma2 family endonuclease
MTPVATAPGPAPAPEAVTPPPRPRGRRSVVIENVEWETYEKILEAFDERNNARFAYDNGALEIMAPPSMEHESDGRFLAALVPELADAFGLPLRHGGSVTVRRKAALKGIEPDTCFWLPNAPRLAGVKRLDLTVHPPPDLAIEVDVTSDTLDKHGIYAGLGIPELWRLDGDDLRFHQLGAGAGYTEVPTSPTFPGITPADLMRYVTDARVAADQGAVTRAFREWLRGRAAGGA